MTNPNKIILSGDPEQHEAITTEDLDPGELLEITSNSNDGAEGSIQAHAGSDGDYAVPLFAAEAPLRPSDVETSQIDATIPQGDQAQYYAPKSGDVIYGWLVAGDSGSNATLAAGDYVESVASTDPGAVQGLEGGNPLAVAEEGVVNTGAGRKRIKLMVI